jgi:hypothetical protein
MPVVKLGTELLPISETAPPPTEMPLPTTAEPAEIAATANGASGEATSDKDPIVDSRGDAAFGLPGATPAAAEPTAAAFAEGVPLDFVFYALRKFVGAPVQQAVNDALAAIMAAGPSTESVAADEVVIGSSLYTHPSLYAGPGAIKDDERIPRPWLDRVNRNRSTIEHTLRSVGRIPMH